MAPVRPTEDFYAVLGLPPTAGALDIKKRYRELALVQHPDRNGGTAASTATFQLLSQAHETLTDLVRRADYDRNVWPYLRKGNPFTPLTPSPAPRKPPPQASTPPTDDDLFQKQSEAARIHLSGLRVRAERLASEKSKPLADQIRLCDELHRFQEQDREDARKDLKSRSWSEWFFGRQPRPSREKLERDVARLQRIAATRIKLAELGRLVERLSGLDEEIQKTETEIFAQEVKLAGMKSEEEARRVRRETAERERREEEAKRVRRENFARERREKIEREFRARAVKEQMEEELKERRERAERARREDIACNIEERLAAEQREATERARRAKESQRKSKQVKAKRKHQSCEQKDFWTLIDGQHQCSHCQQVQKHFAFECPGCGKVACASCRRVIRGEN